MTAAIPGRRVIPITYMNSDAVLKAFVGEHGGLVCTSSNAERAFRWAYERGDAVFFFPDEHLGRNVGAALGIPPADPPVWDPRPAELGGIAPERLTDARLILWKGFCNVHTKFTVAQIEAARAEDPDVAVIVHPECPREVVVAADEAGSTDFIIRRCEELPAGSSAVIGTDANLVGRLAARHSDKHIRCLNESICPCVTMNRIDLPALDLGVRATRCGRDRQPGARPPGRRTPRTRGARPHARARMTAEEVARVALAEDLGERGDVSGRAALPHDREAAGEIVSRADGVLAGTEVADAVADLMGLRLTWRAGDGSPAAPGVSVCRVTGPARALLAGERTMLNLLCRLSGVASLTARYVSACAPVAVLDTRKTTPGLRALEKAAVRAGGGRNHRAGLHDGVMFKDNHLALLDGDLAAAVARARAELPGAPVEIEADDLDGVLAALAAGADWILLDNMDTTTMRDAVEVVAGRARTEASGGMTLERARAASTTGVDAISIGALTHSAPALDLGLDLELGGA